MSLLWPEPVSISLLAGGCRLRHGSVELDAAATEAHSGEHAYLDAVDALISAGLKPSRVKRRVQVLVSDGMALIVQLPWQSALSAKAEMELYAYSCFEREGFALDDAWAMQAHFRHFGASGLAYALPRAWLEDLRQRLAQRQLVLDSVLPVTAAAFWAARRPRAGRHALYVLSEEGRITSLTFGGSGLLACDVEPAAGSPATARLRLMRRLAGVGLCAGEIYCWSGSAVIPSLDASQLPDGLAAAKVQTLPPHFWSRS